MSASTSGRAFLDTNVLVYLFDGSAPAKKRKARELFEREGPSATVSTQVLSELYVVLKRKLGAPLTEEEAEGVIRDLSALRVVETDAALVLAAARRSREDRLSFWDALIVEAALQAGCRVLLSEDLQAGRSFGALRVANPFASER